VFGVSKKTTACSSSLTDTFDLAVAGNGIKGDTITVSVTPNDGTVNGTTVNDSATVVNSAPVVDTATIDEASATSNDTLHASYTAHDPDGDSLTPSYQWYKNGVAISGETGSSLNLATAGNGDKGDTITVRVSVSDGSASDNKTSAGLTISNSAPSATVSLGDHSPKTNDTLTATATRADADGDAVSLHYVWKNGSTVVRDVTKSAGTAADLSDSLDLSGAGNGNKGDTMNV
jgi:hypothetical protein